MQCGGCPGVTVEGRLVRPENFESYVLIGEVSPIEDQPAIYDVGIPDFWEAKGRRRLMSLQPKDRWKDCWK